jgi:hypothetical protein
MGCVRFLTTKKRLSAKKLICYRIHSLKNLACSFSCNSLLYIATLLSCYILLQLATTCYILLHLAHFFTTYTVGL